LSVDDSYVVEDRRIFAFGVSPFSCMTGESAEDAVVEGRSGDESDAGQSGRIRQALGGAIRGNVSFVGGILGGGVSYPIGFVVVSFLFLVSVESETTTSDAPELFELADASLQAFVSIFAWVFYGAHGVKISLAGGTDAVHVLSALDLNTLVYALIPAAILFVFGGIIALLKRASGLAGGFVSGASVVFGYLPLVVAGALFFQVSAGGVDARVQLLPAILIAGLLYPLVCGGLAGVLKVVVINVIGGGIRERL
jgi:hypothetical protein